MRSYMALTDSRHVLSDAPLQAGLPSMHANADYDLCPAAVNTVASKPEMTKADRPVVSPLQTMCRSSPYAVPEKVCAGAGPANFCGSSCCRPNRSRSGFASASMAAFSTARCRWQSPDSKIG